MKPFVKWVGGKGQLLNEIRKKYPIELGKKINKYCEPFVGGGAVLFDILSKYDLREVFINDINYELINSYINIRDNVGQLIEMLFQIQNEYISCNSEERKKYYYLKRERFNNLKLGINKVDSLEKSTIFLFLNKTCFNGLFRVNSKGLYNVPMGAYKNPIICDEKNLLEISEKLHHVIINCGNYHECISFIDNKTFVYIDPPYRPITQTAYFTAYTENLFTDKEQMELRHFVDKITAMGAKVVISNSDPKNLNSDDHFFDNLYKHYFIERVLAKRMINCNGESRGNISELLITSF